MYEAPGGTGTLEEETPMEDSPSAPKRKASSLLMSLLGQSFTDTEGTVEPKTPYARAEEEIERYCKAPSLPEYFHTIGRRGLLFISVYNLI